MHYTANTDFMSFYRIVLASVLIGGYIKPPSIYVDDAVLTYASNSYVFYLVSNPKNWLINAVSMIYY